MLLPAVMEVWRSQCRASDMQWEAHNMVLLVPEPGELTLALAGL